MDYDDGPKGPQADTETDNTIPLEDVEMSRRGAMSFGLRSLLGATTVASLGAGIVKKVTDYEKTLYARSALDTVLTTDRPEIALCGLYRMSEELKEKGLSRKSIMSDTKFKRYLGPLITDEFIKIEDTLGKQQLDSHTTSELIDNLTCISGIAHYGDKKLSDFIPQKRIDSLVNKLVRQQAQNLGDARETNGSISYVYQQLRKIEDLLVVTDSNSEQLAITDSEMELIGNNLDIETAWRSHIDEESMTPFIAIYGLPYSDKNAEIAYIIQSIGQDVQTLGSFEERKKVASQVYSIRFSKYFQEFDLADNDPHRRKEKLQDLSAALYLVPEISARDLLELNDSNFKKFIATLQMTPEEEKAIGKRDTIEVSKDASHSFRRIINKNIELYYALQGIYR